jgi:4-hydroxythreonine-4-phosphate dehydrogenase
LQSGCDLPEFYVVGDGGVFRQRAQLLGADVCVPVADIPGAKAVPAITPGEPDASAVGAIIQSIEITAEHVMSGQASAMVTLPIAKNILYAVGFRHPGHTEFLGYLAQGNGSEATPVMMLACDELKVVPVTVHAAIRDVPAALSGKRITTVAKIVHGDMRKYFNCHTPRLAITGLNPHAGENGAMGNEEKDIIIPAISELQKLGIMAKGPYPADTIFHANARKNYDVALAMYHDQALIPIKTLAFERGVNVTLGLPFVRTSPDHGTAFDIAGTGAADPASFIAALQMAAQMARSA